MSDNDLYGLWFISITVGLPVLLGFVFAYLTMDHKGANVTRIKHRVKFVKWVRSIYARMYDL